MLSTSLLFVASLVVGQADIPSTMPEEIRAHLEKHLVGEWTFERTWGEEEVKGDYCATWDEGKYCLVTRSTHTEDGKKISATELLGWDSKSGHVLSHGFSSDGASYTMRWTRLRPNKWTGRGAGWWKGKEWKSKATMEWEDDLVRYEDVTEGKPFVAILKRK